MRKRILIMSLAIIAVSPFIFGGVALSRYAAHSSGDTRERAEFEHGVSLPPSVANIQCRGDGWLRVTPITGGGVTTMFEMSSDEVPAFIASLAVRSRAHPVIATGDPLVNGYNVWPQSSETWVPGNQEYGGFHKTWEGSAVSLEMVSCGSPVGMWLHVEFWKLEAGGILVKMCTLWMD